MDAITSANYINYANNALEPTGSNTVMIHVHHHHDGSVTYDWVNCPEGG